MAKHRIADRDRPLAVRFPWFTVWARTRGHRVRCFAAVLAHEFVELVCGTKRAHAMRAADRYAIGAGPPPTKGPGFQPIAGIQPRRPVPSILTSARQIPAARLDASGIEVPWDWRSGISWRAVTCQPGYRWPFCQDDAEAEKSDPETITKPDAYPYAIYVPFQCAWGTPEDVAQFGADAKAQLDAVTPWHVSRELWAGGTESENDSLQSVATDVSAAAPVHPVTALGSLLEAYFACILASSPTGAGTGQPLVHAPLSIITSLLANNVIAQQGDYYVGPGGSIISPGPGYPSGEGAAPDDHEGDINEDAWMYVSGPVEYALSDPVLLDENHDRRTNLYIAKAERLAIHRFDPCCVFAIAVYQPSPEDSANV